MFTEAEPFDLDGYARDAVARMREIDPAALDVSYDLACCLAITLLCREVDSESRGDAKVRQSLERDLRLYAERHPNIRVRSDWTGTPFLSLWGADD